MKKKYEVVISGVAGRFPESDTLYQLERNLLDKKDLITCDERRWKKGPPLPDVPCSTGKIKERDTMDQTFFGLHRRLCEVTDPNQRICIELAFSAVLDAGVNPNDLWGSNTAVITNSVTSETEYECLMDIMNIGLAILGHSRSMQANRISYALNLTGPSLMVDCSWNGGAEGLAYAADLIERGAVQSAIVASSSIIYTAEVAYHYWRMGRLTPEGRTRCFSDDADGYNRSEGCVAFFLQRKDDALRSYGSPLSTIVNFNGSKEVAFSELSKEAVTWYLQSFYSSARIDPTLVSYVEAAGVASKAVDAAELNGLAEVMVRGREKPLLVGCVKSNLGHTEASSASVSIAKALIVSNSGLIPPNLHYNKPNSLVPTLTSGEIQVVTEPTPLEGDYIAVNSISSTSGFAHVLIRRHEKAKSRLPEKNVLPPDGLPRLFLLSGRNEQGVKEALKLVEERPIDEEYVALANNVFKKGIKKHTHRGYTVLNDKEKSYSNTKAFFTGGQPREPVWWVFTGMGSQWPGMGVELMKLPVFAKAINNCHNILSDKGIDLINIITTLDSSIFDNILHSFVGIAAVQIGLVDVLKEIGLEPDGIVGHSVGELGCAYADGCFTAEQMILAAYARGKASLEADLIPGMMAAVGRGYKQIKDDLPEGIEVACHNSKDSCTLSGPAAMMEEYIGKLKTRGIFAKLVNVANIAYHSRYIRPAAPTLLKYLKEVIPEPKARSPKWISSSVPESEWDRESARFSSAEYHTNNLLGSVLFEEASAKVPQSAVILEIAPHGLLQAILKRSFPSAVHIPLTSRIDPGLGFLFNGLGKLYLEGAVMDIEKLYPPVEFPVSRGTPSLNELVIWDHSELWRINLRTSLEEYASEGAGDQVRPRYIRINPNKENYKFLYEYSISNQATIPISFYVVNVIQDFQRLRKSTTETLKVQNIKIDKLVELTKETMELYLSIGKGSGSWEFCDGLESVASGEVQPVLFGLQEIGYPTLGTPISPAEIYSFLGHMGHELGRRFRLIKSANLSPTAISAVVEWNGDLVCFLDAVLKLPALLSMGRNVLSLVTSVKHITIDFTKFKSEEHKDILVNYDSATGMLICEGLEILYPRSVAADTSDHPERKVICGQLQFIPYNASNIADIKQLLEFSVKILFNNMYNIGAPNTQLSVFEVQDHLNIHDQLFEVLKWRREVEINIKVASTDCSMDGDRADPDTEYCFILTGSDELVNSISILKSSRGGLMLLKGHQPPSSLATVFTVEIDNEKYSICTVRRELSARPVLVLMSEEEEEDWRASLKLALLKSDSEPVYLLSNQTSLTLINETTLECSKLHKSHLLRFIFIDSDLSEFDFDSHRCHLEKDLKVNILQGGEWGVCLSAPLDLNLQLGVSRLSVYPFSHIRCEPPVDLKAISLNPTDISCVSRKMDVFEYSGTCCRENVRGLIDICGIGKLSEYSRTLHADPIFQWRKPPGWSHEQAATVLVPYVMAFHILNIGTLHFKEVVRRRQKVFVHQGHLPFSQAVINLCFASDYVVYSSYRTQAEKEKILELFPQIPEEHLFCTLSQQYGAELLRVTKGLGVKLVINTLPELEALRTSLSMMSVEGIFYQISQPVIVENVKMGMMVFLHEACVEGVTPLTVLDRGDDYKREIHRLVQDGFDSGLIQPFSYTTLSPDLTNIEASSHLSFASADKIVVRMDGMSGGLTQGPYVCDPKGSYIILGDESGFWLDLLEWIVKRGASFIYIVVFENMLSVFISEKLRRLQDLNPHVRIVLTPEARLHDLQATEAFIAGVSRISKLDSIFIIGEVPRERVTWLAETAKSQKLVVLCEKAELLCEGRLEQGHPTLAVTLSGGVGLTPQLLLPRLDKLLMSELKRVNVFEEKMNNDIGFDFERTAYIQHLPSTVAEVLELSRLPRKAEWREVKTSSPSSWSCPEVAPVFVIPPLKRGQMNTLLQNLFHPTFVALTPQDFSDFQDLAHQLYEDLLRFNTGVFTFICSDWSWIIGILLGKLLEAEGKTVSLIFFESSISWESVAAFNQVQNLVTKDLALLKVSEAQKEKISSKLKTAYTNLRYRLNLFSQEPPASGPKFKGICHYIRPNIAANQERLMKIQERCEQPLNIYTADEYDFLRMLENRKLFHYINTHVMFEYKDAANKMDKVYVNDGVFQNPRLSYMDFLKSLHENRCLKTEHTPL